jgi:hypothetical protein
MPAEGGPAIQITSHGGFEAIESFDRKFLFYSKFQRADALWRIPISGGQESLLVKGVEPRYWAVAEEGIYFAATEGGESSIKFIDFVTRRVTRIIRLERKLGRFGGGLALSPDSRSLLCRPGAGGEFSLRWLGNPLSGPPVGRRLRTSGHEYLHEIPTFRWSLLQPDE